MEKKKKCNINFIRLKRGGTVVNVRISAKGSTKKKKYAGEIFRTRGLQSTRRRSMLGRYSEQEYYRAKERRKDGIKDGRILEYKYLI
jgi:hypothetical protein